MLGLRLASEHNLRFLARVMEEIRASIADGTFRDDEINRVVVGANFGWHPQPGGYNESVPMTDLDRFPEAVPAVGSSGRPVEALSGAAFLTGPQWGELDGTLAVGALRGEKLLLMTIGADGGVTQVGVPGPLDGEGRQCEPSGSAPRWRRSCSASCWSTRWWVRRWRSTARARTRTSGSSR